MTLVTAEGIYRNGAIELLETPEEAPEGRVLVTFLGSSRTGNNTAERVHRPMQFGQFSGPNMSTEDDYIDAEWHGEGELDAE